MCGILTYANVLQWALVNKDIPSYISFYLAEDISLNLLFMNFQTGQYPVQKNYTKATKNRNLLGIDILVNLIS